MEALLQKMRESKSITREKYHAEVVGIFGSYSRNDIHAESDLDVLYRVTDPLNFGLVEYDDFESFLSDLTQIEIIDLVNVDYINPIIELEIEEEIIHV
jgi:predicted nucleotidyltransferase